MTATNAHRDTEISRMLDGVPRRRPRSSRRRSTSSASHQDLRREAIAPRHEGSLQGSHREEANRSEALRESVEVPHSGAAEHEER
jgi:hypothetical protein